MRKRPIIISLQLSSIGYKNAAGKWLWIRPFWLEQEVKIPVEEFSQYRSIKRKWSAISRPQNESPLFIKKEPEDDTSEEGKFIS